MSGQGKSQRQGGGGPVRRSRLEMADSGQAVGNGRFLPVPAKPAKGDANAKEENGGDVPTSRDVDDKSGS